MRTAGQDPPPKVSAPTRARYTRPLGTQDPGEPVIVLVVRYSKTADVDDRAVGGELEGGDDALQGCEPRRVDLGAAPQQEVRAAAASRTFDEFFESERLFYERALELDGVDVSAAVLVHGLEPLDGLLGEPGGLLGVTRHPGAWLGAGLVQPYWGELLSVTDWP